MKKSPIPQGKYIPASRYGNLVYSSGMTPRVNGVILFEGKIKNSEPLTTYKEAVRLATSNALIAVQSTLIDKEYIEKIVTLTVYINAEEGFAEHSRIADFAAEYLYEELGEYGIGSRTAIGVTSLPSGAKVEIQIIASVSI